MIVKYLHWLGIAACITLVVSCFLPWVHYADINQNFTGFYSYQNQYGKPGKFLVFFSTVVLILTILPKLQVKSRYLIIFFSSVILVLFLLGKIQWLPALIYFVIAIVLLYIPDIWAKWINLFIAALTLAYAIKTFILFSSCYNNYCPQKLFSLYLMVFCTVVMLLAAVFPKLKIKTER
jgi:hypothetical protein